jgi:eukaryotic-like serine/threonine-protein kinase
VRKVKAQPENTVDTILRAGQIVDGKYRVDRLLGQGGMAAVWAGTNERSGKRVALKVILRSLAATHEAQQLLHREALAASRVNHPNVVTVFDVIEHEGMTCIVMELLEGEPLGSYIARNGFLSVSEATAILLPAMRGVAAAHAQGVIHRDLKPQNIFICVGPDGRIVTSKVLDFGISVMVERVMDPSAGSVLGLALGTPAYMSPEHISGGERIDQRADVYGFGLLLYEALTGQMPFPGEQGSSLFDRILNQPAPAVTLFRPDLPPGLVRIIERAMAKQPEQRYAGLNSMVGAIEDELAPATPPPRLLTPIAGVPLLALRDPASGPNPGSAVQAIVKQEPSGQHQETQILFGFPLEKESKDSAPNHETQMLFGFPLETEAKESVPDEGADARSNEGSQEESAPAREAVSNGGSHEGVTPQLTGPITLQLRRRPRIPRALLGPALLSPLRGWRGLVAVGCVALLVLVVGMAMRDARPARTRAPVSVAPVPVLVAPAPAPVAPAPVPVADPTPLPSEPAVPSASQPAAAPVVPAPATTVASEERPAPPAASPAPPAPSTLATVKPRSHARVARVPVVPSRSPVALRETLKGPPPGQNSRGVLKADEPARTPPSPPRAVTTAKPAPRAGSLSADDF